MPLQRTSGISPTGLKEYETTPPPPQYHVAWTYLRPHHTRTSAKCSAKNSTNPLPFSPRTSFPTSPQDSRRTFPSLRSPQKKSRTPSSRASQTQPSTPKPIWWLLQQLNRWFNLILHHLCHIRKMSSLSLASLMSLQMPKTQRHPSLQREVHVSPKMPAVFERWHFIFQRSAHLCEVHLSCLCFA